VIVTPAAPAGWTALARRGMLWSEVQVFDVTVLAAGGGGPELDPDCHELLFCVAGSAGVAAPGWPALRLLAGQCLALAPQGEGGAPVTITAGGRGATLLRVRALPAATSRHLPPRRPSLDGEPQP
jgi:hypothetical protein